MGPLIEVVGMLEDNCINCHQCIAVCPVKRNIDGSGTVVRFNDQLCIGCGRCIGACIKSHGGQKEKSARFPIDDTPLFLKDITQGEIIILLDPSAVANFNLEKLITALRALGALKVFDVSLGAEIMAAAYHEHLSEGNTKAPLISRSCPVVVRHIELLKPALVPYLAPVGSPARNLAVYVSSLYPDKKLAYISPCLAKRREFAEDHLVKYNVLFSSLQLAFAERGIKLDELPAGDFDGPVSAGIATAFSAPGGLKRTYLYRYPETLPSDIIQVGGFVVYSKYLHDLEEAVLRGETDLPLLIDVFNCEHGCNMGPGSINRLDSMDYIIRAVEQRAEKAVRRKTRERLLQGFITDVLRDLDFSCHHYHDRSSLNKLRMPTPIQLDTIYKQLHKSEQKDFRNCGACGYHSCYHMAVAIFNGLNKASNCRLYQEKGLLLEQQMLNEMLIELENLNRQLQQASLEQKAQEQLLIQSGKLAAVGEMIGMIAHQWRQPLSSISTIAGHLRVLIELDSFDAEEFIQMSTQIGKHAQYLSKTINDFRHFFKPDNPRDVVCLDSIIDNTLGIIGKSLEYKSIKLVCDYHFKKSIVTYPTELMQVFLNLIKNAVDALAENNIKEPLIIILGYEDAQHQVVEIKDNAGGIPENVLPHVFDPYFSTKGPSIGTGVGLYMSKMIVEEHCRGKLEAHNGPDGACFVVKLPQQWGD